MQDLTFTAPQLPRPTAVHVYRHRHGRARRFVTGGQAQLLVLDVDEGQSNEGESHDR